MMMQSDATMNLLKANRYQLMCARNELSGRPLPIEAYNEYITTTKDKVSLSSSLYTRYTIHEVDISTLGGRGHSLLPD